MPWSGRQNRLFRAIEHGWRPPARSGIHIGRADATRMAHEGVKRAMGGLASYDDYDPPRRGSPRDTVGAGTRAYADGGPVDDRTPLYAMPQQQSMAPAIGNVPLTMIEQMRPIGMADGGPTDMSKLDPRTAMLMRLNARIKQSTDFGGSQAASRGILERLSMRRSPGLSALAPSGMASSMGLGRYPLPDMSGSIPGYAEGGEVEDSFVQRHPLLTGAAATSLAALRPRYVNRLARPISRALARPMFSAESVSDTAMPASMQRHRFDLARSGSNHEYKDMPVHDLQGAWQGDRGMEYNRLFAQELPRQLGRVRDDRVGLAYAGQMGENLEQQAVPVNRFVPHLWNTDEDANAMMVHGIDDAKLRRLAEIMGPDVVTAHRPGNRAMVFPLGDQRMRDLADETNAAFAFPRIRYGRSDPGKDRVLLTRKPWGDLTYGEAGADPRDDRYAMFERAALNHGLK